MQSSLVLSAPELDAVVSAAEDAAWRLRLSGSVAHLDAALSKLRRERALWSLRAPPGEAVALADVEAAFREEGEAFPADASFVVLELTGDVHFGPGDTDFSASLFGRAGVGSCPVFQRDFRGEAHRLASDAVGEVGWLPPGFVLSLFEPALLEAFAQAGLPVLCNPGWPTAVELAPLGGDDNLPLFPERG